MSADPVIPLSRRIPVASLLNPSDPPETRTSRTCSVCLKVKLLKRWPRDGNDYLCHGCYGQTRALKTRTCHSCFKEKVLKAWYIDSQGEDQCFACYKNTILPKTKTCSNCQEEKTSKTWHTTKKGLALCCRCYLQIWKERKRLREALVENEIDPEAIPDISDLGEAAGTKRAEVYDPEGEKRVEELKRMCRDDDVL